MVDESANTAVVADADGKSESGSDRKGQNADVERIQKDVRQLLADMQASFQTTSSSVLNKIDVVQGKIGELEQSIASLTSAVQETESSRLTFDDEPSATGHSNGTTN